MLIAKKINYNNLIGFFSPPEEGKKGKKAVEFVAFN